MAKVYSTETGRLCAGCGEVFHQGPCMKEEAAAGSGKVRVSRETKGRKGAGVTLIAGVPLAGKELKELHKMLKKKCSVGGAIKDDVLELQGDQRERVLALLAGKGWDVKASGG